MNWVISEQFISKAIDNVLENQKCKDLHPNSCNYYASLSGINAMKSCRKLYFFVHLFQLIMQIKRLKKNPVEVLTKFVTGYIKSMLFVGGSLFMIRRVICLVTQFYKFSTPAILISGLASGLPLLIQSKGRQSQISLYCLKEGLDMGYLILKRRYPSLHIQNGESLIFAFSIAVIIYQYFQQKSNLRQIYKKLFDFVLSNI